jgi:hypothetical protein
MGAGLGVVLLVQAVHLDDGGRRIGERSGFATA